MVGDPDGAQRGDHAQHLRDVRLLVQDQDAQCQPDDRDEQQITGGRARADETDGIIKEEKRGDGASEAQHRNNEPEASREREPGGLGQVLGGEQGDEGQPEEGGIGGAGEGREASGGGTS